MHIARRMRETALPCSSSWAKTTRLRSFVCTVVIAACQPAEDSELLVEREPERWSQGVELDEDLSGDLRPEALALIELRNDGHEELATIEAAWQPPATIRVWRRGLDGSTASCSGRVDVIPFETYVKGVLPHEWIPSWDPLSLEMGAVAIRTYAWWWIEAGGKYDCADLDDTTASQVYEDEYLPKTDAAVDVTAGVSIVRDGSLVFAEYSAENSDPTDFGVDEPYCSG